MKWLILLAVICVPFVAEAGHNGRVVEQRVVVPFAVPVATPVAVFSPVTYQNQVVPYTDPPKSAEDILLDRLATLVAAKLEGRTGVTAQAEKPTLFATNCASCHKKGDPDKGKPQFTTLEALTAEQRLKCIEAIVGEHMPPGKKLTPAEVGQHILELSTVPKVKATEAPPEPKPEKE